MLRQELKPISPLLTLVMLGLAVILVLAVGLAFKREQGLRAEQSTASDRVLRSPLLPESGWKTYGSMDWSMGYPDDWVVRAGTDGLSFIDEYLDTTYLTVSETVLTDAEIRAVYAAQPEIIKSEFLFAGYPAIKYTLPSNEQRYFIFYNEKIITLDTFYPEQEEVGIMLVTFQFLY